MTAPRPIIAVSVPSGDTVHADFALSLAGLCNDAADVDLHILSNKSSIVAIARNNGVAMAGEAGADYLLFLDSDMVFPRVTLRRLLMHGQDIVGATYTKRVAPYPVLGTLLHTPTAGGQVSGAPPGLVEMKRIPTGCLLIRMSVFDKLPKPYFRFAVDEATGDILGEDYVFCDHAREAGFHIWCDHLLSMEIGHIGQQIFRIPPNQ
jgi:hypothetical protein